MTPAAERCRTAVLERFTSVTRVGVYNRRPIAGTTVWSQHSWANGLDFHLVTVEEGDQLTGWLTEHKTELGIRVLLWRVDNHWNVPPPARHVHADFWPKGVGTPPPTQVGTGWFRYPDGTVIQAPIREVPAHGEGVGDVSALKRGSRGAAVVYYQEALNGWGDPQVTPLEVDGAFGPAVEAAVREYQKAADLPNTGVIGEVESHLIGRYHPENRTGAHEVTVERVKELIRSAGHTVG